MLTYHIVYLSSTIYLNIVKQSKLIIRAISTKHNMKTVGSKVELIMRIKDTMKNPLKDRVDKGILEDALMRWQQSVQKKI